MRFLFLLLSGLLLVSGCTNSETGIEGELRFDGKPLVQARVELYLKNGEERSSAPFSVATTDAKGRFHAELPNGNYYLVGKKKEQGGGVNRMLMAEYAQNPVVVEGRVVSIDPLPLEEVGFAGAIASDGRTSVKGRLLVEGQPLADAFVYVYTQGDSLTGPSYGLVVHAGKDGTFELPLSPGRYWLAARRRSDGSRVGDPQVGDLSGEYSGNPLVLEAGDRIQLAEWSLQEVTATRRQERLAAGKFVQTDTWISGRVVDEDELPVAGIYLFAYRDSRMIGKPSFISTPTGTDGTFRIYLDQGGEFFVGARSTFGGPLEPGEWVGTYDGRADHGIEATGDVETPLGDILVREVW